MPPISKIDKKTWENYIADFNNFNISLKKNKNIVLNSKKVIPRKTLSHNHFKLSKQMKLEPDGVLDLHGYRLHNAKITLQKYILKAYENNLRNILIITGKGYNNTGILKKEVPLWLNDRTLINLLINFKIAPKKFGGEGALLVKIKNKNKFRFI